MFRRFVRPHCKNLKILCTFFIMVQSSKSGVASNVCFHSRWRFLDHFIEFVRFGKNNNCAEMGLRVLKMFHLNYHDRFEFGDLKTPINAASSNWAISIKTCPFWHFVELFRILMLGNR